MSGFQLSATAETGACRAGGELSFANAVQAHAELQHLITVGGKVSIDCGALERIDSAGLAVLLDIVALARAQGTELRYVNLPAGVLRLARLGGVESLLPV
ncbi:MAG: hypothetical protein RLY56_1658 [Pseudomonadota bacterium]|jgi:phospholipid transport system transporter-binding protein